MNLTLFLGKDCFGEYIFVLSNANKFKINFFLLFCIMKGV